MTHVCDADVDAAMGLAEVTSLGGIEDCCRAFAATLGAQYYEFKLSTAADQEPLVVSNAPSAWREKGGAFEPARINLILQRARGALLPVYWDEWAASAEGSGARLGSPTRCSGITASIVGRVGDTSAFSITQSTPYPADARHRLRFGDRVRFFTTHAHMAALRILSSADHQPLSVREKSCLTLADRGLTTDAIGRALCITGRTVLFHLENAGKKLGTHGRHNTLRRAKEIGALDPLLHAAEHGLEVYWSNSLSRAVRVFSPRRKAPEASWRGADDDLDDVALPG